jgi:hypothetical protein
MFIDIGTLRALLVIFDLYVGENFQHLIHKDRR